jgi:hypothetical protein
VVVQQGKLNPTDTTKNMQNYYSDSVVTDVSDVNRGIHNGTQFVRLVLQRPLPVTSKSGGTGAPDTLSDQAEYIDGQFTANPTSGVNLIRIGFATGQLVDTTQIVLYSTQPMDTVTGNWNVATSSDGTDSQFNLTNFQATGLGVAEDALSDAETGGNGIQFKYTVTFTLPAIGGLQYWRIKHTTAGIFNDITEVEVLEPLVPRISYFDTDGSAASTFPFEQANILDAAYDNINGIFYTIRFNDATTGTSLVTLSDTFDASDAGTASGTTNFNPGRWTESSSDTAFLRVANILSYNVASGKGQLETNYTLTDFESTVEVNPTIITTDKMWFVMRALDTSNKALIQEGVGYQGITAASGVWIGSAIENFVDATANSELRDVRPLWHNTTSGTDEFTIQYNGATWNVSGTLTGGLANATTGVLYNESIAPTTPIEFLISSTATPTNGEQFTFDLTTSGVGKKLTESGIVGITRVGSDFTTSRVFTDPLTLGADIVTIELFGNTDGSVNISANNFEVPSGTGVFPDVSVFTVERTDNEGDLVAGNPTVIESFDVIGDPSKSYNDFINGRVQIATTQSGTGGGFIYLKIDDKLFKYPNDTVLGTEDGTSAVIQTQGQIAKDGTHSLSWTRKSGIGGLPFLTYHEYEESVDLVHLRTINKDTLQDTTDDKEVLLDQSGYSASSNFKVFYDQNDFDTLYYVDASTNLQSFNIDDRISAFMAVNAEDVTLPAGTSQQTFVNADVINAWGETLDGKVVTFAVTAGDGATAPSSDTTTSGGRATTQFTVGSTVGVSTVTATVTET